MQQVVAQSRFWWRALDAQSPAEPRTDATDTTARFVSGWHFPTRRPMLSASPARSEKSAFRLEIPKGERRPRRRSANSRPAARRMAVWGAVLALACAGAASAVMSGSLDTDEIRALAAGQAQEALLGLGFGIDQVGLTGHHFTSDRDVYKALDLEHARTFAAFDAEAALRRIEALSWVDSAQITRLYPGGLRIEIRERRPAALWDYKGRTYLIDETGRALGAAASNGWHLPRVSGDGANSEAAALLTALGRHPGIAKSVERADRIGARRWSILLKNGSRLELAADREVEGLELVASTPMLKRALTGPAHAVDVRTPGRVAVRPLTLAGTPAPAATERLR